IAAKVASHSRQQARATYYAKLNVTSVDAGRHLIQAGFYVVDVQVTLAFEASRVSWTRNPAGCGSFLIRKITPDLAPAVCEIARTSFRFSRFHLDPLVTPGTANRIKHDWIQSYVNGQRGEHLFVALKDGRPAGFLAVLATRSEGHEERVIDLIGVA